MRLFVINFLVFISLSMFSQVGWNAVSSFGTNPGNLAMYSYAPSSLPLNAPLVVVMHGCTQTASQYALESGWNTLADQHQFYTVYPEQNMLNNSNKCFNWFLYGDQNRGQGEALSIKQMIEYMKLHFNIDSNKIFVTGLSAGACMTNVMLASYPELFEKGAVMAGTPYKSATSAFTASSAMYGLVSYTPSQWADSVKHQNPTYVGPFPEVALFHGGSDFVVNFNNVAEQVKQWTNVHSTDQIADLIQTNFNGNSLVTKKSYIDASNSTVVETYTVSGMGHAIAVDPGTCYQQGGTTGTYATDVNFHSSFWAAYFFNILHAPLIVSGPISVTVLASGVSYSVPVVSGSTYTWTAPSGATILSGQGTNSIIVNFGSNSGYISVTTTDASSCKVGPINLFVNVGTVTSLSNAVINSNDVVCYQTHAQTLMLKDIEQRQISKVKLYSITGDLIKTSNTANNTIYIETKIPQGIYILECNIENNTVRKKILINE